MYNQQHFYSILYNINIFLQFLLNFICIFLNNSLIYKYTIIFYLKTNNLDLKRGAHNKK